MPVRSADWRIRGPEGLDQAGSGGGGGFLGGSILPTTRVSFVYVSVLVVLGSTAVVCFVAHV